MTTTPVAEEQEPDPWLPEIHEAEEEYEEVSSSWTVRGFGAIVCTIAVTAIAVAPAVVVHVWRSLL